MADADPAGRQALGGQHVELREPAAAEVGVRGERQARAEGGAGGGPQAALLVPRGRRAGRADLPDHARPDGGAVQPVLDLVEQPAGQVRDARSGDVGRVERGMVEPGRRHHRHAGPLADPDERGGVPSHAEAGQLHDGREAVRPPQLRQLTGDHRLLVEECRGIRCPPRGTAQVDAQMLVGEHRSVRYWDLPEYGPQPHVIPSAE
ncbi:hypothetical protein LUX39_49470 [Actinomadura madurae]|nr:hypothetical protein [Actinomadura madurae]MCQ0020701.1 hypothetical protein [Actinomadura madurae]